MRRFLPVLPILALVACDPVELARRDDPGGTACRVRMVERFGVEFEETTVTPLGANVIGLQNYLVEARGQRFRCTIDAAGQVAGLMRTR